MPEEQEATLADVVSALRDVQDSLREVGKWVRFQNVPTLRSVIVKELDTAQKKMVFELTDGHHSRRDIAKEVGTSDDTIRGWWDKWFQLAIVSESEARKGRPERIVSLAEVGIEVPKLKLKPAEPPAEQPAAPGPDASDGGSRP